MAAKTDAPEVTLITPMFNESARIRENLRRILEALVLREPQSHVLGVIVHQPAAKAAVNRHEDGVNTLAHEKVQHGRTHHNVPHKHALVEIVT